MSSRRSGSGSGSRRTVINLQLENDPITGRFDPDVISAVEGDLADIDIDLDLETSRPPADLDDLQPSVEMVARAKPAKPDSDSDSDSDPEPSGMPGFLRYRRSLSALPRLTSKEGKLDLDLGGKDRRSASGSFQRKDNDNEKVKEEKERNRAKRNAEEIKDLVAEVRELEIQFPNFKGPLPEMFKPPEEVAQPLPSPKPVVVAVRKKRRGGKDEDDWDADEPTLPFDPMKRFTEGPDFLMQ